MAAVQGKSSSLKYVKASMAIFDPPFGFKMADWDKPEDVWSKDYWFETLKSLRDSLLPSASLIVFGNIFNVFPPLVSGIEKYNSWANANGELKWVSPVQLCFHKTNKPHKGTGGYSQSVDNVAVYYFGKPPAIKELPVELGGSLMIGARPTGKRLISDLDGNPINPCQKSCILMDMLLKNHSTRGTAILDLTAGSFVSFLVTFLTGDSLHWIGCDSSPTAFENFENLVTHVTDESGWFNSFIEGDFSL
jgi:hypothetical protein